jgi:acyl-CoA synthetase (NDP forming)
MSFESFFYPHAVVVNGSMSEGKLGQVLLKKIIDGGYEGKLFAVNPKAQGAFGVKGFLSVESIGEPVDWLLSFHTLPRSRPSWMIAEKQG